MRINGLFVTIIVAASMQVATAQQISFSQPALSDISKSSLKEKTIIPVSKESLELKKKKIRNWVGASIDLEKSTKRESTRFNRVTFKSVDSKDVSRSLEERIDPIGNIVNLKQPGVARLKPSYSEQIPVLYREGPMYFKFAKIQERKASSRIDRDNLIKMVKEFVTENQFITETEADKIGSVEVCDTRIDEDGQTGADIVAHQNVIFRRTVDGLPVVNSMLSVAVYPDTKEIVEMDCFNWASLDEKSKKIAGNTMLKNAGVLTEAEVTGKIKNKILAISKGCKNANVKEINPGWFQSDNELLPVLIINYDAVTGSSKEPVKYMEVVNLAGDDAIINKDYRSDYKVGEMPQID